MHREKNKGEGLKWPFRERERVEVRDVVKKKMRDQVCKGGGRGWAGIEREVGGK